MHDKKKPEEASVPHFTVMPKKPQDFYEKRPDNTASDFNLGPDLPQTFLNNTNLDDQNNPPNYSGNDPILEDEAFQALLECYGPSLKENLPQDPEGVHPRNMGPTPLASQSDPPPLLEEDQFTTLENEA